MRGRTTFIIAHRLSTLEKCDMRLQLENGRLEHVNSNVATSLASGCSDTGIGPMSASV